MTLFPSCCPRCVQAWKVMRGQQQCGVCFRFRLANLIQSLFRSTRSLSGTGKGIVRARFKIIDSLVEQLL
jgi:hypothetical protein